MSVMGGSVTGTYVLNTPRFGFSRVEMYFMGLATPAALVAACGRGAQLGIFIKGHQALESSGLIDTVVLDKTGTVTSGRMTVTALAAAPGTEPAELLRHAAAVERASEHPVAAAVCAAWEEAAREGLAAADGSWVARSADQSASAS